MVCETFVNMILHTFLPAITIPMEENSFEKLSKTNFTNSIWLNQIHMDTANKLTITLTSFYQTIVVCPKPLRPHKFFPRSRPYLLRHFPNHVDSIRKWSFGGPFSGKRRICMNTSIVDGMLTIRHRHSSVNLAVYQTK